MADATGPRPPAGRTDGAPPRHSTAAAQVRVAVFGGGLVLAGLGAAAVGSVAGELTASATTTAVRLVLLVAGAVVAGLGLVRPLTGARVSSQPGPAHRRVAWTAGLLGAAAALAGYLHGDVGRVGTLLWVLVAVAVPVALSTRFVRSTAVAAVPVLAVTALTLGSGHTGAAFAADVVYAVATTAVVGVLATGSLQIVGATAGSGSDVRGADARGADVQGTDADSRGTDARGTDAGDGSTVGAVPDRHETEPATAPGRPALLAATGLVAGAVALLAGAARILLSGPYSLTDLVGTAYGRAALVALLLPAATVAMLVAEFRTLRQRAAPVADGAALSGEVRHAPGPDTGRSASSPVVAHPATRATNGNGAPRRAADAARSARRAGAAAAAVVGVAAASVAGLLPVPAPAAVPGQALLRTVALDGANVPIMIAPMRPGPNLVQLGGSGYRADGGPAAAPASGTGGDGGATADGAGPDGAVPGGAVPGGSTSSGSTSGGAGPGGVVPAGAVPGDATSSGAAHGAAHGGTGHGAAHDMADHGGQATVQAGGDPVPFASRTGARGGWAVVDIPAGTGSVTVTMGGDSATVPVSVDDDATTEGSPRAGSASSALVGRDGPECASAIVGAVLARGPEAGVLGACPAQALDPGQASALRSTVVHMAAKGARSVRLVSDPSPRSVAAARLVREEGARVGLVFGPNAVNDPNSAVVVVSGWEQAVATLGEAGVRARTTPTHLGGTFLAPWLLTGDVLRQTASAFLPLSFAPNEPEAQRYAIALAATYPDTAPSASGYLAWARAAGVGTDDRPSLYGAAAVNVPMSIEPAGSAGHHGGPNPAAWFPGGTVVPVTGPLEGSP